MRSPKMVVTVVADPAVRSGQRSKCALNHRAVVVSPRWML